MAHRLVRRKMSLVSNHVYPRQQVRQNNGRGSGSWAQCFSAVINGCRKKKKTTLLQNLDPSLLLLLRLPLKTDPDVSLSYGSPSDVPKKKTPPSTRPPRPYQHFRSTYTRHPVPNAIVSPAAAHAPRPARSHSPLPQTLQRM